MSKKNPFLTKKALSASNTKRLSRSTPEKDISKVELANDAIQILKRVKANFRRASAIDAVRKTRKTYHLGGLKTTANFMNKLAELPATKVEEIKKIVENKPTSKPIKVTPSEPKDKTDDESKSDDKTENKQSTKATKKPKENKDTGEAKVVPEKPSDDKDKSNKPKAPKTPTLSMR